MHYGYNSYSYNESMSYQVIALPSVSVNPMGVTVFKNETVNVTCKLTSGLDYASPAIYWFKDGKRLTQNNGLFLYSHSRHIHTPALRSCISVRRFIRF